MTRRAIPKIVAKTDLDKVSILTDVRKAVYVMKSVRQKNFYRFGAIGIKSDWNTGIRRLGQCTGKNKEGRFVAWEFVCMAVFNSRVSQSTLKHYEGELRKRFINKEGAFRNTRVTGKDAFRTKDHKQVVKLFKRAVT